MSSHDYPHGTLRANRLGAVGFVISLLGFLFSAGFLCPLGLVLSLIAVRRPPRGQAIAGAIIGFIGMLIALTLLYYYGTGIFSRVASLLAVDFVSAKPHVETANARQAANSGILTYSSHHGDELPDNTDGQRVIVNHLDGWGHLFHYQKLSRDHFEIRSAGPDGRFDTQDDEAETFKLRATGTSPAPQQ